MTSLFCPKCSLPQPMNVASTSREESSPDGKKQKIITTTYHCAICYSFVRSEDQIQEAGSSDQAA